MYLFQWCVLNFMFIVHNDFMGSTAYLLQIFLGHQVIKKNELVVCHLKIKPLS